MISIKNKRRDIPLGVRFKVLERDGFKCVYCGAGSDTTVLEIDHIQPVAKGGTNIIENLVTACLECNRGKSAKIIKTSNGITERKSKTMKQMHNRYEKALAEIKKRREECHAKGGRNCRGRGKNQQKYLALSPEQQEQLKADKSSRKVSQIEFQNKWGMTKEQVKVVLRAVR